MSETPPTTQNPAAPLPVRVERNYQQPSGGFPLIMPAGATACQYCGAPLDPFYYFCLRCATPYKTAISMIGPERPLPLTDEQRVQKMAPQTWTVFWTYAIVLILSALIAIPFDVASNHAVAYFISTIAIFITTFIFAFIHWRPLKAQLAKLGFLKWQAWAGIGLLVPLLILNFAYHSLIQQIPGVQTAELPDEIPLSVGIFVFCLFPAITEEIAFRGLIQYWLDISLSPRFALFLGSAMFAVMHFSILSAPYLLLVGMALAWVRRKTGSLYPGMLMHFLHNLVVLAFFR